VPLQSRSQILRGTCQQSKGVWSYAKESAGR
jgi:hypothetical protein